MIRRRTLTGAALTTLATPAFAAGYPDREITAIVQYAAGGSTDVATRAVLAEAEKLIGVPVQVINRPGGQGTVGPQTIAAARPDGYTIGTGGLNSIAVTPHMLQVSYTPDSFTYLPAYAGFRYGIGVRAESPLRSLEDLIAAGRSRRVTFGATGAPNNLGMFALGRMTGARFQFIPFPSGAEAVTATMGGHVEAVIQAPPEMLPAIQSGRLRLLASASPDRWDEVPDVPTVREMGHDLVVQATVGFVAPRGLPEDRLRILNEALQRAAQSPNVHAMLLRIGMLPQPMTAELFERTVRDAYASAGPALREAGLARR
ncbi:Bug family tripartite tricarboxylate transporter substrate binding protein [Belnapia moabensis]|uniref:Bug family tripartite tricarboxylate transporter substrate binding protein n=1 Tax=Belnapia moabensis TaxID=365533 RepID=UPI0005BB6454|nr:tripartite tricarboxylate transporter substrate binding protein [Belnapia moabensis]